MARHQLWLDRTRIRVMIRARGAFFVIMLLQGALWIWSTVLVTAYRETKPTYDWASPGYGRAFALFLFWVIGFQINYLFL